MRPILIMFCMSLAACNVTTESGNGAAEPHESGPYTWNWRSPIDQKYLKTNPALFAKFEEARGIMDAWRGRRSELHEADLILMNILTQDPFFAPAYRERGRLLIAFGYQGSHRFIPGSLEAAEASISRSIEIEPEYADAYVLLGHLYENMNQLDSAEQALEKAEEIGTKSPWLQLNWASLLAERNQFDAALERYQAAASMQSKNRKAHASALSGSAKMFTRVGDYDSADKYYQELIAFEPESAWNWGNYANFLLQDKNDVDRAIVYARGALERMNYGNARRILGVALYTKWARIEGEPGAEKEAQQYFDEAIAVYPDVKAAISSCVSRSHLLITADKLTEWLWTERGERI